MLLCKGTKIIIELRKLHDFAIETITEPLLFH